MNAAKPELPSRTPLSDIVQREDGFHIFMDMPGVPRENLVLDLKENELVVRGATAFAAAESEKYLDVEFGNCEYRRAFTLSEAVDRERIVAVLKNGVLAISLPKADKLKPKRIEIHAE